MQVDVHDVALVHHGDALLVGASIDAPTGGAYDGAFLHIEGWVIGRAAPVVAIRARDGDRILRRTPVDRPRPDVTSIAAYSDGTAPGFLLMLRATELPRTFQVSVEAVLESGQTVTLGTIQGSRSQLAPPPSDSLSPIAVTGMGRSGGTWLLNVLGSIPGVAVHRPFECEARLAIYWTDVFRQLTSSQCVTQQMDPPAIDPPLWWCGPRAETPVGHQELGRWLGREHLDSVAAYCRNRVETFYREVAEVPSDTIYFAEKMRGVSAVQELYPELREIILVRDFRDVLASVLSFNHKRGFASFGRELVDTDEAFVLLVAERANDLLSWWQQRRTDPSALLLRYEDLILDEQASLRAMLLLLGIDPAAGLVASIVERAHTELPQMAAHRTSNDSANSVGKWRRDLSPSLQTLAQDVLTEALAGFGYTDTEVATTTLRAR
jgi:sulfotransferase family protein